MELPVMFSVDGGRDLHEHVLTHLVGWRGSRPVRVGNGAWSQRQLDIYGEILAAAGLLRPYLVNMSEQTRGFLISCADAAARQWQKPDRGIWEVRGPERQFVHSKVMCWVALDRAMQLADLLQAEDRVRGWQEARDDIHRLVMQSGWNAGLGAFSAALGARDLDASALRMPLVGFLPPDHPRVLATIDVIERDLTDPRGLVYRYRTSDRLDGLNGDEGTFLLCTFWLAEALAMSGQSDRAEAVFSRAAAHLNDVSLLAEEVAVDTGELLGNFPQAFSHVGLINAAWAIARARHRTARAAT